MRFGSLLVSLALSACSLYAQDVWQGLHMPSDKTTNLVVATTNGDIYSVNSDALFRLGVEDTWIKVLSSEYGNISTVLEISQPTAGESRNSILVGTTYGGILRSDDNGQSWYQTNKGIGANHVARLWHSPEGYILASTPNNGVYRSDDNGLSWSLAGLEGEPISSFAQLRNGKILLGTYRGVFISDNGRAPWSESSEGLTNRVIEQVLVAPNGNVLAGGYLVGPCAPGGMFLSKDNGKSWNKVGFEGLHVKSLQLAPSGAIYAATWCGGVFVSNDNGENWSTFNTGLDQQCVQGLAITPNGRMVAAAYGAPSINAMYQINPTTAPAASVTEPLIGEVNPNPATTSTAITYTIHEKALVTLMVVNNVGELQATLVNEVQPSGTYTVKWDASKAESGMYGIRIQAGKQSESTPVIIVK